MLSSLLLAALVPYETLCNKHALSALYRTVELSPQGIRGCSNYGALETSIDLGILEPCYVDATTFIAVVKSLPPKQEVALRVEQGSLSWKCVAGEEKKGGKKATSGASGKLATLALEHEVPSVPARRRSNKSWTPTEAFKKALELGSLSCDQKSLSTIGMDGVVLDNRDGFEVYSSDNVTISQALVWGESLAQAPESITFSPESIKLLRVVIGDQKGLIEFDKNGLYYSNSVHRLLIKRTAPLEHDYAKVATNFSSEEVCVPIAPERIKAFVQRATAMSEAKRGTTVSIGAKNGRLVISFKEGTATSDEYYLIDEELEVPDLSPIALDASKLARAMQHIDTAVLDHMEDGVLKLRGEKPEFRYIISSKR